MDSNSEKLWLQDLYTTATYPFSFCIATSQIRHSVKDVMITTCTANKHHLFWHYLDDHSDSNYSLPP